MPVNQLRLPQMRETTSAVRRSLRIATLTVNGAVCSALLTQPLYAGTAQFALSSLNNGSSGSGNGENGFLLNGIDADDRSGWSVSSAGDINGDGLDDVIIGAPHADSNNVSQVSQDGESYVVFGGGMVGVAGELELSTLDGSDGFVLNGVKFRDNSGHSVSAAGDVNGDGVDDVIIGMNFSFPSPEAGASFIVFGGGMVGGGGELDLSTLDGSDGFVINGIDGYDSFGSSVSAVGDINGDGVDDVIIGAPHADPNGNLTAGESYVIFGRSFLGASGLVDVEFALDGANGFVLNGIDEADLSGDSVSAAGDVNGDGIGDLLIGALAADPNGSGSGETYVVFGAGAVGSSGSVELSALDGSDGYVINGLAAGDTLGWSVSAAGDINSDGVDDLIIGAPFSSNSSGESYVIFGGNSVGSTGSIEIWQPLDGTNGFVLKGIDTGDRSGHSVSAAGDFNGDGVDDVIIGAPRADPNDISSAGEIYLLFGGAAVGGGGQLELSALNGNDGFVLTGIDDSDRSGSSVSAAGDINGDGVDDVIIGAPGVPPNSGSFAGESYVVFGKSVWELAMAPDYVNPVPGVAIFFWGQGTYGGLTGFDEYRLDVGTAVGANDLHAGSITSNGNDDISNLPNDGSTLYTRVYYRMNGETIWRHVDATYTAPGDPPVVLCNGLEVTVDLNLGQTTTPNDDVVLGTEGDDVIRGKAGNDTICGEGGDDFIHGNSGNDWIDGGDGVDNLRGGQGNDVMYTGTGATVGTSSRAFGGYGDDEINGDADADDLRGGRGIDTIKGFGGDDVITGNEDKDIINGGSGFDTVKGGNGDDDLRGGADNDVVNGGSGDDVLNGGAGAADVCDGGGGTGDTATASCETVTNVP